MSVQNNSGGQHPRGTHGLRPHKVTNATSDRELILIWLGGKSQTTQVSYRSTVEKFIEFINKPLSEVKLEDLQLWERSLKARFKLTTVANKVLVIKSLFSFAVQTGYLTLNVGSFIKPPKVKDGRSLRADSEAGGSS